MNLTDKMLECGSMAELQALKAKYGHNACKQAWLSMAQPERDRIAQICRHEANDPKSPNPTLDDLASEERSIQDILETLEGENLDPSLSDAIDDLLSRQEKNAEALQQKLEAYIGVIADRKRWIQIRELELKSIQNQIDSDRRVVDFLSEKLKNYMESSNRREIRTKRNTVKVVRNGGKQPMGIAVADPEELPPRFRRTRIEIDKAALRQALEASETGIEQYAYWRDRESHLRIR